MKRVTYLSVIVLSSIITNSVLAQFTGNISERTKDFLKTFRSEYIKSKTERLINLTAYYDNTIRLMPEFQNTIFGKSNVLLYENAFAKRFEIQNYNRTEMEVIDLDERVIESGTFEMKIVLRTTGQGQEVKGKYVDIWKRENNGLRLMTQAWNYNHPLQGEEKLKFDEVPGVLVALQSHVPIETPVSFELGALNCLMEKVITEHDAKIWSQFYSDDAMFLYSRSPVCMGRKLLDEFFDRHVKDLPVFEKLDVRNDRIDDLGKYVIEYASHIAIIRDGDFSGVFTGKDLAIWRREKNGSLKIFRHIGMYD